MLGWVGKYSGDYLWGQQVQSGKRQQWAAEQFRSADLCLAGAASGARAHIIVLLYFYCEAKFWANIMCAYCCLFGAEPKKTCVPSTSNRFHSESGFITEPFLYFSCLLT